MYLGIDIGGTKTLLAAIDENGTIRQENKFSTPKDYDIFLSDLAKTTRAFSIQSFQKAIVAVPGLINRDAGIVHSLGNLPWRNKPIRDDICKILDGTEVTIENDSKIAGLYEARLIPEYKYVLFLTISTGINGALIHNGRLVPELQDSEMGKMPLLHKQQYVHWEDFAGGRSVVERFHKKAGEISDPEEWRQIAELLSQGLAPLVSVLQPEVIVLGGGVGAYTDQFSTYLLDFLQKHLHPNVVQPKAILQAKHPNDAVIYGCYELTKN